MKKPVVTAVAALVAAGLAAGPAQAAVPGTVNDLLVQEWYADFLGRDADEAFAASGGRGYWVDRLDAGEDPRRILESIQSSAEFAGDLVDGYYDEHLGRDAAADPGAEVWRSGIRGDTEPEWVEQNVLASPEYAARTGERRVELWYRSVLGRSAGATTAGEVAYWERRIGEVGALNAVREVWYSSEGVERRIRAVYADLLDRPGSRVGGGEVDYWYDRALDSDLGLRTDIALSAEYAPPAPPSRSTSVGAGAEDDGGRAAPPS